MSNRASILVALTLVVIAGCQTRKQPAESPSSAAAKPASESTTPSPATAGITDQWLGKWIGPEGTYLVLSKKGDQYVVKVNSLDGLATYEGTFAVDHIEFQRNGQTEVIRAGIGKDTGMKWLMDKKNCLIIKPGEGFCRD